jgi:hypothetical protein
MERQEMHKYFWRWTLLENGYFEHQEGDETLGKLDMRIGSEWDCFRIIFVDEL